MISLIVDPVTVRVAVLELPPPGGGLFTVTERVRANATKLAGSVAVRVVELLNEVATVTPFTITIEEPIKFVPITAKVTLFNPTGIDDGFSTVIVGIGFAMTLLSGLRVAAV